LKLDHNDSAPALSQQIPVAPMERRSPCSEHAPAMSCAVYWLPRSVLSRIRLNTDRGSTYTAKDFTKLCDRLGIRQSMGRVGSCFDNAASEAFFSTLEHEVLSRHHFRTRAEARAVVVPWCQDFYNVKRLHSSADLLAPDEYERIAAIHPDAA
jgi:putative transposase